MSNLSQELLKIKDKYGENMMHFCRKKFSTILEYPGLLFSLLEAKFAHPKFLYDDIINNNLEYEFKNYIYGLVNIKVNNKITNKSAKELMSDAGYLLYECKSESDVNSFKKYYANGEVLCTFYENRLEENYVFFAVKKNVDEIKRENFPNPKRQDEYGISVISIQFERGRVNTLSIKNRYNDRVDSPDATFSNNLENIISGLTYAFERDYNLNIYENSNDEFNIPLYIKASDGKYYKYNYEINGIYYCPDNIIIDGKDIIKFDQKERYIVLDYFILDLKEKNIRLYDKFLTDSFGDTITNISTIFIEKLKLSNNKNIHIETLDGNVITIQIDKTNRIIGYYNNLNTEIGDFFLYRNTSLKDVYLPNNKRIGSFFLNLNNSLKYLYIPSTEEVDDYFLYANSVLKEIVCPSLVKNGDYFLENNSFKEEIVNQKYSNPLGKII